LTSGVRKNLVDQRILAILARGARYVRQNLPGENGDSKRNFLQILFADNVFFRPIAPL